MATFAQWFKEKIDEPIKAIKIESYVPFRNKPIKWPVVDPEKVYSLGDFGPWLNIEFDDGYGAQECPNIYVYTDNFVYYVHEYDGSTCLRKVPRNP